MLGEVDQTGFDSRTDCLAESGPPLRHPSHRRAHFMPVLRLIPFYLFSIVMQFAVNRLSQLSPRKREYNFARILTSFTTSFISLVICFRFSPLRHVTKTKNRNHSINKVKILGYDRWLLYKQPRQDWGLSCSSFARSSQKCVTQICRALYEDAMFVHFGEAQTWMVAEK